MPGASKDCFTAATVACSRSNRPSGLSGMIPRSEACGMPLPSMISSRPPLT